MRIDSLLGGASPLLCVAAFLEFPPARPACLLLSWLDVELVVVCRRCRLGCGVLHRACIAFWGRADLVQRACEPVAGAEAREGWRAASSLNPPMLLYR